MSPDYWEQLVARVDISPFPSVFCAFTKPNSVIRNDCIAL
jgi:hypothetical protein